MSNEDIRRAAQAYLENATQQTAQPTEEAVQEPSSESDHSEEVTQEAQDDLIEIKAAGEVRKLSFDEIKELAAKGFDYTKKTQELSERVKTEAERQVQERLKTFEAEKQRLTQVVDTLEGLYGKPFVTAEQLDQLIAEGNTEEYLRLSRQEEKRKEILEQARSERNKIIEQETKARQEQFQQEALNHANLLFEKMPELKDSAAQQKLAQYLTGSGFKPQEIESFVDHRGLIIAEKARRYDELSKGKAEPVKNDPPKVIRKVGSQVNKQAVSTKEIEDAASRLAKTGSLRDAVDLYLKQNKR